MTWRRNTNEEIEELRRFVDGMKRGQTLATGDSLLETLRQIHDRQEAPVVAHDHRQMLKDRLRRQMAAREGLPVEDPVPALVFIKPVARPRILKWAAAASLALHVGLGAVILPNVEFDMTMLAMGSREPEYRIVDIGANPFFAPPPPRPNRKPTAVEPKSEREPSSEAGRGRAEPTEAGPERSSAMPAIPSRPIAPPVAPGTRPVVYDYGASVEGLADSRLPDVASSLLDGPSQPAKVRPFSDVKASAIERAGPVAESFDVKPKILVMPKPMYTEQGLRDQVEGIVRLMVVFSADGVVREIQVVRSLGAGLDEAAIEAARKIKFMPASRNGTPVSARMRVDVRFSLR